ncbi:MAG: 5-(carboxyamino)imidazole ribonucleotide synthase [Bacteroidales bacterium]
MERLVTSNLKLGIISGGQLGKMLIQEASKWDIITYVMDPEEGCPAGGIASVYVKGNQLDFDDVYRFGKQVDVLTFELENINVEALKQLKAEGLAIVPDPIVLELIQDKGLQKDFYQDHDIPTSPYQLYQNKEEIIEAINSHQLHYPFVQKLRKGGYDGRGVAIINGSQELTKLMEAPSVVEQKVAIEKEIAVIAARNSKGEIRCFPAVEMMFDNKAHLVEKLVCPSLITEAQAHEAEEIATRLIELLGMAGLLAVELFVDTQGYILVNEVAPRPHNSGHHTIESVITSQFEQHIRAILDLPLGSTHLKMPAVMLNLLGETGHEGPVRYEGLTESLAYEGVKIHLYGKKITRPYRKMGHTTIIAATMQEALEKAEIIKNLIKVKSWDKNL